MTILLFEDKLGITSGYESIWQGLLLSAGLAGVTIARRSSFKAFGNRVQLLTRKGNRKAPGFNPDPSVRSTLTSWVHAELNKTRALVIVCMDPALFFLMNPDWDQATPDNMRGGVYEFQGVPLIGILPMSAYFSKKSSKDIARLNEGYSDKDEWEADHGGEEQDAESTEVWLEPITVPYGKFVLLRDMQKVSRIYKRRRDSHGR